MKGCSICLGTELTDYFMTLFHLSWFFPFDFWAEGLLILICELRDSSSLTKQENLETPALAPDEGVSKFPCRASPVNSDHD